MNTRKNTTTIRIKRTTKADLEDIGKWGETHDEIIRNLILSHHMVKQFLSLTVKG